MRSKIHNTPNNLVIREIPRYTSPKQMRYDVSNVNYTDGETLTMTHTDTETYETDKYRATVVFIPQQGKYLVRRYVRYNYWGNWTKRHQFLVSTLLDARIAAYLHIVRP